MLGSGWRAEKWKKRDKTWQNQGNSLLNLDVTCVTNHLNLPNPLSPERTTCSTPLKSRYSRLLGNKVRNCQILWQIIELLWHSMVIKSLGRSFLHLHANDSTRQMSECLLHQWCNTPRKQAQYRERGDVASPWPMERMRKWSSVCCISDATQLGV